MKRRKMILCSAAILCLMAVDQFSKLFIKLSGAADTPANFVHITNSLHVALHFHPELNVRFPLAVNILIAVVFTALIAVVALYVFHGREMLLHDIPSAEAIKSYPKFTTAAFCMNVAGTICSIIFDAFLWGGSLDFICIEWYHYVIESGTHYTDIGRLCVDLKDIFIMLGWFMLWARWIMMDSSIAKLPKSDKKLVKRRYYHPIAAFRDYKSRQGAAENE